MSTLSGSTGSAPEVALTSKYMDVLSLIHRVSSFVFPPLVSGTYTKLFAILIS